MTHHIFAAGWLAGRASAAQARIAEDLEAYRCRRCRRDDPDAPMSERLGECADCQRAMLLSPVAARRSEEEERA